MTSKSIKKKSTRVKKPIPEFSSYQEEAKFWDTHDTTDYFDPEPVKMKVAGDFKSVYRKDFKMEKQPTKGITVRFPVNVLSELRQRAARLGIGPTTLVRMWIIERLQEIEGPRGKASGKALA
jgi:predicted DNA binding CopG/RHH family protein